MEERGGCGRVCRWGGLGGVTFGGFATRGRCFEGWTVKASVGRWGCVWGTSGKPSATSRGARCGIRMATLFRVRDAAPEGSESQREAEALQKLAIPISLLPQRNALPLPPFDLYRATLPPGDSRGGVEAVCASHECRRSEPLVKEGQIRKATSHSPHTQRIAKPLVPYQNYPVPLAGTRESGAATALPSLQESPCTQ